MRNDLQRVLFDEPAIHKRLDELAGQILNDYRDRELTVIAVLNGSLMFVADLLRRIPLPLKLDCLSVVSYHGKAQTSGEVIFRFATANPSGGGQVALPDIVGRDVLILDDILDSGHTLAAIREKLQPAKPRSIRVCVLLSKKKQRARHVDAAYVGFEIEDEFVVGYGLDFMERYRNLPYIGVLRKELLERPRRRKAKTILNPWEGERRKDTNAMKARVQFYAQLRDLIGTRELEVDFSEGATVGDLLEAIYSQQPALRVHDKSILIGTGLEFVDRNHKLKPGEEIAIMPPVQGG